jgi:hypothetical protein
MSITLPKAIEAYFAADRDGGPEDVAAAFTEDGIVKDKGIRPIRAGMPFAHGWLTRASSTATRSSPFLIAIENGKTLVTAHAVGDFPGSPIDLRFFFVLAGDKVAELEITV